jgi:hypothetical protein
MLSHKSRLSEDQTSPPSVEAYLIKALAYVAKRTATGQTEVIPSLLASYLRLSSLETLAILMVLEGRGWKKKLIRLDFNQRNPKPEAIQIVLKVMYEAASLANLGVKPQDVIYLDVSRDNQYTGAKLNKSLKKEIDAALATIQDMWGNIRPN